MNGADRKTLLVRACESDRIAWRQACKDPADCQPLSFLTRQVIRYAEVVGSFLPGRWGRWLRGASFLGNIASVAGSWMKR